MSHRCPGAGRPSRAATRRAADPRGRPGGVRVPCRATRPPRTRSLRAQTRVRARPAAGHPRLEAHSGCRSAFISRVRSPLPYDTDDSVGGNVTPECIVLFHRGSLPEWPPPANNAAALRVVFLALCAACALSACGRFADRSARAAQQNRVVSVSKQINEFLYAIGAQSDLVAVDLTSIYPAQIRRLPTVGYHRALSAEGIISMRPTLFLTDGNVGPDAVLQQLRTVGIPIEVMQPGGTLDSSQMLLAQLGRYFHHERAADSVLAQWKAGMQAVWADTARWNSQRHPRVLLMHFGQI